MTHKEIAAFVALKLAELYWRSVIHGAETHTFTR
jgi:hypothetical protein